MFDENETGLDGLIVSFFIINFIRLSYHKITSMQKKNKQTNK